MKKGLSLYISSLLAALLVAILTLTGALYSIDCAITDRLYAGLKGPSPDIIIIGVDEETLNAYGNYNTFIRQKCGELTNLLFEDSENAPAVLGIDILFVDNVNEETDAYLADAVTNADRVVNSCNLVYRGALSRQADGTLYYDTDNISFVEMPFDSLLQNSKAGFVNVALAKDGVVRYALDTVEYTNEAGGESHVLPSFARRVYEEYCDYMGMDKISPVLDDTNRFGIRYSGKSGEYSHVSLKSVLEGNVPPEAFKDKIVLFGAYAPGFMDSYISAVDRSDPMYGVEINANIIQNYIDENGWRNVSNGLMAAIMFIIVFVYLVVIRKQKLPVILASALLIEAGYVAVGMLLASRGCVIPQVYMLLFIVVTVGFFIIERYVLEYLRRRKTLEVFSKYVAPEVVSELTKSGDFKLVLGGEKRNVAVLFVDIRGFTPLSESMEPEEVVAILNVYLSLTTRCIFAHHGTLDKFVGDATMAVFNAPFDQDDYIYEAVATAWDIKQGSRELGERLYRQFGKHVGFGVGVNCGEAVVGNIGCEFRMDYTAIGDTVNTAARLEANAKAEEVLISEYVYEKLKGRIEAEEVGEIPLKGKSNKIMVYRVTGMGAGNEA